MPVDQLLTHNSNQAARTIKRVETRQRRWRDESLCKDYNGHMTARCHVYAMNSWEILAQREDYIVRIFLFVSCQSHARHLLTLFYWMSRHPVWPVSALTMQNHSIIRHLLNHFSKLHLKKNIFLLIQAHYFIAMS